MSATAVTDWELYYEGWEPSEQPLREALTTLGNGLFATRGAAEEARAGGPHYPGTYLAGGYDRAQSEQGGRIIENEDLVNWPNWLPLSFRAGGGPWFDLDRVTVLDYEQRLDLYRGVLTRRVRFRDRADRETLLESRRIVDMAEPHIAAIEWVLTPLDWSGEIEIRATLDGGVTNSGVARYRALEGRHIDVLDTCQSDEDIVVLVARTRQSHLVMAQAARTRVHVEDEPVAIERHTRTDATSAAQHLILRCEKRKPVRVEKVVALATSRDFASAEPRLDVCKQIHRAPEFADLLRGHELAWEQLWRRADLELELEETNHTTQGVLRLHVFHLLQTASANTIGRDVGVPARGLHGEAYRGHIFWDELFVFPFLNLRLPQLTRSLLLYRYRRLDEARHAARKAGHRGAMFPWQSGSDGREETQTLHLNPRSGHWLRDNTHRQRHVGAAIAYNVWQYYQATDDFGFLSHHGAEMLVAIARFWGSIATYDAARERYVIRGVVGPDEFHTDYPGQHGGGLDNNAYTNVMAAWTIATALRALEHVTSDRRRELLEKLGVSDDELRHCEAVSRQLYVPILEDGIIEQFEGWNDLEELDWDGLRRRHGDIQRLDRILEAEGDDPNRYKATKQADVLMLFFLFSTEQLTELFERLGYRLDPAQIPQNVAYYLARTSNGSSLSRVVNAWVLARSDRSYSWRALDNALRGDIEDAQHGTTSEGIHLGAMASTVDLVQRCHTGLEMRAGALWINPCLPDELDELRLSIIYHGHRLALRITHDAVRVTCQRSAPAPALVGFAGEVHEIGEGDELTFALTRPATSACRE